MKLKTSILLSIFCIIYTKSFSQTSQWDYLNKSLIITGIQEDWEGNIWIADYTGIAKYNPGTGIYHYLNQTSHDLPKGDIRSFKIDKYNHKWFTVYDKGLVKYDDHTFEVFDTSNTGMSSLNVLFEIDFQGNVWVVDRNKVWIVKGKQWTIVEDLNQLKIHSIYADQYNVWLKSEKGLHQYNYKTWTLHNQSNSDHSMLNAISMTSDQKGNLWIANKSGLEKYDGQTFKQFEIKPFNTSRINHISSDSKNNIWIVNSNVIGSPAGGVHSFNELSGLITYNYPNYPVLDNKLAHVFVDSRDRIWAGGLWSGLVFMKQDSSWTTFNPAKSKQQDRNVRQIEFDKNGNVLIASGKPGLVSHFGEGIVQYNGYNWTEINIYKDYSRSFAVDQTNDLLYVRSGNQLIKYVNGDTSLVPDYPASSGIPNIDPSLIKVDQKGEIWMDGFGFHQYGPNGEDNFHEGLYHFDGSQWQKFDAQNSGLPATKIHDLEIDNHGSIWLSTDTGLVFFDRNSTWKVYDHKFNPLIPKKIRDITIDKENNIWFGEEFSSLRLIKFNGTTCEEYVMDNPIYAETIRLKIDNKGKKWIIPNRLTLVEFDGSNWKQYSSKNSKMPNVNLQILNIDQHNNKWIGTNLGTIVFNEGGIVKNQNEANTDVKTTIYPNPFSDQLTIRFSEDITNVLVELFDFSGKKVLCNQYEELRNLTINELAISSGMYIIRISSNNHLLKTAKVFKL